MASEESIADAVEFLVSTGRYTPAWAHDEIMSLISGEWEELFITVGDCDYVVFVSDYDGDVAVTDNIIQVHPEFYRKIAPGSQQETGKNT